jgi:hypothetical protein
LLNEEAAGVASFDWFKHRTGSMRCQTSAFCFTSHSRLSRVPTSRENEKEEVVPEQVRLFLFRSSTDPVAKERFFLERFTCFQQG